MVDYLVVNKLLKNDTTQDPLHDSRISTSPFHEPYVIMCTIM